MDWIFFYSRNAVRFFFQGLERLGLPYPSGVATATIGAGTAEALVERGIAVDFVGFGNPERTADRFALRARGKRVLFPRARQSRRSVEYRIDGDITVFSPVVYNNSRREDVSLPDAEVLIFTSPLNAKTYYGHYEMNEDQLVIAFGPTTSEQLKKLGIDHLMSAEPSEQGLVKLLDELMSQEDMYGEEDQ